MTEAKHTKRRGLQPVGAVCRQVVDNLVIENNRVMAAMRHPTKAERLAARRQSELARARAALDGDEISRRSAPGQGPHAASLVSQTRAVACGSDPDRGISAAAPGLADTAASGTPRRTGGAGIKEARAEADAKYPPGNGTYRTGGT